MSEATFQRLEDVVLDESFPDVDLALRRGRHIDRDDGAWYTFLCDGQAHLEAFYRRFGAELVKRSEGYFYLLPSGERLGRRQLSVAEMLVGQTLTLLYLDPATLAKGGVASRSDVLSHLASVMGADSLIRALNPKRKKYDERVAQETVRARVAEALRRLSTLGFVDLVDEDSVRLRAALMRFAEPVRGSADALEQLISAGEVVLTPEDGDGELDDAENPPEPEESPTSEDAPRPGAPEDSPPSDDTALAGAPEPSATPFDDAAPPAPPSFDADDLGFEVEDA